MLAEPGHRGDGRTVTSCRTPVKLPRAGTRSVLRSIDACLSTSWHSLHRICRLFVRKIRYKAYSVSSTHSSAHFSLEEGYGNRALLPTVCPRSGNCFSGQLWNTLSLMLVTQPFMSTNSVNSLSTTESWHGDHKIYFGNCMICEKDMSRTCLSIPWIARKTFSSFPGKREIVQISNVKGHRNWRNQRQ